MDGKQKSRAVRQFPLSSMHNWWIVLSKHLHAGLTRQRREDRPWEAPRTRRSPRVYGMYRWPAASCLQVGQIKGDSEGADANLSPTNKLGRVGPEVLKGENSRNSARTTMPWSPGLFTDKKPN